MRRGNFEWRKGLPNVKNRVILQSYVQKRPESIEMSFGLWARMGPSNRTLDWVQIPYGKAQFGGKRRPL